MIFNAGVLVFCTYRAVQNAEHPCTRYGRTVQNTYRTQNDPLGEIIMTSKQRHMVAQARAAVKMVVKYGTPMVVRIGHADVCVVPEVMALEGIRGGAVMPQPCLHVAGAVLFGMPR